jgi:hypothetical protein
MCRDVAKSWCEKPNGVSVKHLDDMPLENIYDFGLVKVFQYASLRTSLTMLDAIYGSTIVS